MNRTARLALLALLVPTSTFAEAALPAPVNLSFEADAAGAAPSEWQLSPSGEGTVARSVSEDCPEGTRCARLSHGDGGSEFGALYQLVRADAFRGKRVRLRGTLRRTGGTGRAFLYFQTNRTASQSETVTGQPAGSAWRTDELLTDIPEDAETLQFGLVAAGPVEAWIDAVELVALGEAGLGNEPARELTDRGAENLAALARLLGAVRYFHPSDESASLDWPAWTIEAVGPVEGARDPAELARALARLVRSVAPTAEVFQGGDLPPPTPPPATPEARKLAWRHYGLGTTARSQQTFRSRRVGGFVEPEGGGGALWILEASALRDETVRFAASARAEWPSDGPGQAEIWMRAVDRAGRSLADVRRPVEAAAWQELEISLSIPPNSAKVYFGARLQGGGSLFLDRIRASATRGAGSEPREIFADGFEQGKPGQYPAGWLISPATRAAGYRVEVTEERPHEGRRALRIAWELDVELPDPARPLVVDLGQGVVFRLPMAVFADTKGTLPHGTGAAAFPREKPEGFRPSGEDRASRLAGVVLLGAALSHFYPYALPPDWPSSLDRALRSAAEDRDGRAFLDTLRRLTAGLRDNHATVSHASDSAAYRLPLLWRVIEDRLLVTWVDPSVEAVRPGDVVEKVDGTPAHEALAKLEPLVSAATPAYRRYRALELLSAGPKGATRSLRLLRGDEAFSATLETTAPLLGPERLRGARPEKIAELRPGLLYLDLDRIDDGDFEAALPRLEAAEAILFDLRGYPERISEGFLGHLASVPLQTPGTWTALRTRPDVPPDLDHLEWAIQPVAPRLTARVAFLTDERAYSRAETYLDIVSFHRLGHIVGATTGGTNGEVAGMDLPGGYHVTWTGSRVQRLAGGELQGVGISPTVPVLPTAEGVASRRDEVLERAIDLLQAEVSRSRADGP
jgi:hypothetical protein